MSTHSSIYYDEKRGIHIYYELLDDTVHIEIERDTVNIDVLLMTMAEWEFAGLPNKIKTEKEE